MELEIMSPSLRPTPQKISKTWVRAFLESSTERQSQCMLCRQLIGFGGYEVVDRKDRFYRGVGDQLNLGNVA